ncbi:hypothetical protein UFOVP450_92 [uncultured Caudovirales phage]|uniref:Uncharacterized protein n=1 Tax=uncultured Caudovirales phage TaxID=2100421 RepID=A0A6J5MDW9_9CAUD|nr:hypothetical protein UFOVP450_92 [uncultured Caudovirales phage]
MAFPMAGAFPARKYKTRTTSVSKAPRKPVTIEVPMGCEQVHTDLMAYNGSFAFVLDLRSKLCKYGKLSDKQWEAAKKCLAPKPVADPNVVLVDSCNIPIVVSATAARYIAKSNNWSMNPTTLTVTQIKNRDRRGFTAVVKADWSGSVSACRCCGKSLTDWRSQATGVGPVCVKRTGIKYVTDKNDIARFQKEMQDLCAKMGEVEVYIKEWHVKEGLLMVHQAAFNTTPKVVPATTTPANPILKKLVNNISVPSTLFQWDPGMRTFIGKWNDVANHGIDPLTLDNIIMTNPATNNSATFKRRTSNSFAAVVNNTALYLVMS